MEEAYFSQMSILFYQITRRHTPQQSSLHNQYQVNTPKSLLFKCMYPASLIAFISTNQCPNINYKHTHTYI